jgi:hypothetical protein
MEVRHLHLRDTRVKHAVIMCIPSFLLPRRAAYFSDGSHPATVPGLHYGQGEPCWFS